MTRKKILAFEPEKAPPFTGLAALTSILDADMNEGIMIWYCSHYLNLIYEWYADGGSCVFYDNVFHDDSFSSCPLLNRSMIPRTMIQRGSIVEFVRGEIDAGRYVMLVLDRFFISGCREYGQFHMLHAPVIYGYDSDRNRLIAADFFNGLGFGLIELAYDEMEASYCSEITTGLPDEDCIISASLASDAVRRVYFDKSKILYQLERFISGDRFDEAQTWFGVSVYDAIEALIRERRYDQRSFHCVYDQKRMTRRRLRYLETLGLYSPPDSLRRELEELEETALLYRNRLLKLSMYYQKEMEERLDNGYRRLKERDLRFHEILYRELTSAL